MSSQVESITPPPVVESNGEENAVDTSVNNATRDSLVAEVDHGEVTGSSLETNTDSKYNGVGNVLNALGTI